MYLGKIAGNEQSQEFDFIILSILYLNEKKKMTNGLQLIGEQVLFVLI